MDLKQAALSTCMIVFVLSSMVGMGLGLRVAEIAAPLRNWRLVTLSLVANFVVMPAVAVALARLLRLDESLGIGLLLLGAAGGAPLLPKLAQMARGNLAFAVGLMVLLMVITVGYIPIVLPALLPGISVNPAQIARSLVRGGDRGRGLPVPSAARGARQTAAGPDREHQPDRPDRAADVVEPQKRSGRLRDVRYSRRRCVPCGRLRNGLGSWRRGEGHEGGARPGHVTAEHRGLARRRQPELR